MKPTVNSSRYITKKKKEKTYKMEQSLYSIAKWWLTRAKKKAAHLTPDYSITSQNIT